MSPKPALRLERNEPAKPPIALHERAIDDLRFIRQTMERAGSFTAVPGWGGVAIGLTAALASPVAAAQPSAPRWLAVWLGNAVLAILIGAGTLTRKAKAANVPLKTGPGRKFLLSFLPPVAAAIALTPALFLANAHALLPGLWLLAYGAAVVTAGTYSVRIVPMMGAGFMAIGAIALATPASWGDLWMGIGFGALHIAFGLLIARKHGG